MPRYIDADALTRRIYGEERPEIYDGAEEVDWIMKCLDEAPTISPDDVRGVVHCKDCKWWTKQEASIQGRCARLAIYPTGEFYCASGSKPEPPKEG